MFAGSPTTWRPRASASSRRACRVSSPTASRSAPEEGRLRDWLVHAAPVAAGGLGLALAFPRSDWHGAAWVALAPLIAVATLRRPRSALGLGWLAGFLFFMALLRWLNFTFSVYSAIPWPLIYLPTMALAGYCGLYVGLFAAAVSWLAARLSAPWALATAPFLWVAGEWVRGHLFGGFPWGSLGYSQYRELAVIQIAELGGVYAVSFVVLAANAALAACATLPWRAALGALGLAGALVVSTLGFGAARLGAPEPPGQATIAIMQPAIEQPLKWRPEHTVATLGTYLDLTRRAATGQPDLIVWPETATPTILRKDTAVLRLLGELSGSLGVPLLVGSVDADDATPPRYRNTAFLLTERGIVNRYDKMHLVPLGEFVPLSGVLGFVRGWAEFISELEPGSRAVVFSSGSVPFGVIICYEGIFPELVREFIRGGARLMINMTNDAWFGRTSGPAQHLAMYPFRAVEHRTALVRAANTGISAFIAPSGRIVRSLPLFERGVLRDAVPLRRGETLYTRLGDWVAWLGLAVSGVALAVAGMRGRVPADGARRSAPRREAR